MTAQQAASDGEDVHVCRKFNTWVPDSSCVKCTHNKGCEDYWPQTDAGEPEEF